VDPTTFATVALVMFRDVLSVLLESTLVNVPVWR